MRQAILLGVLAGFFTLAVLVLVLSGHSNEEATVALVGAISTIVGVLVSSTVGSRNNGNSPNPPGGSGE